MDKCSGGDDRFTTELLTFIMVHTENNDWWSVILMSSVMTNKINSIKIWAFIIKRKQATPLAHGSTKYC